MTLGKSDIFDAKSQIFDISEVKSKLNLRCISKVKLPHERSICTTSKRDCQLLHQKVPQKISVIKTNTLDVSRESHFNLH